MREHDPLVDGTFNWRICEYSQQTDYMQTIFKFWYPLVSVRYSLFDMRDPSCTTMARGKWHLEDFDCVQHSSLVDWTSLGRWLQSWQLGSDVCRYHYRFVDRTWSHTWTYWINIYIHLTFCLNMHAYWTYWSTYRDGQRDFSTCSCKSWGIGLDPVGCSPGNEAAAFNRAWRVKTAPPVHLCPSDLAESKNLRLGEVMGIKREAPHSAANPWKLAVESR